MKTETLLYILLAAVLIFFLVGGSRDGYDETGHRPPLGDYLPTYGNSAEKGGYEEIGEYANTSGSTLNAILCEECIGRCMTLKEKNFQIKGFKKDREECYTKCDLECSGQL